MKIDKREPMHWLLLLKQGLYTLIAIGVRHITPRPKKSVVVLYGHQLSGNLKALYEEWVRAHQETFEMYFLSLDPDYPALLESQGVNVLRCSRLRDMLRAGRCRAMITDHGLHAMQPFIHLTDIIFIDVWHGIPFKGFVPDDFRVQHRYDEVWVSSPLLKEIYVNKFGFSPDTVFEMGYARVDKLFRNDPPNPAFRAKARIPTGSKIVLYAPTWKQDDQGRELFPFKESQESFISVLSQTCSSNSATLVIRSHLNAQIGFRTFENVIYCPMSDFPDSEELLLQADILICDWSSIAFDFLALQRATLFLDVLPPFKNGFSLGSEFRFGEIVGDMASLNSALGHYLKKPTDYERQFSERNAEISAKVYGNSVDGKNAARQLERLTVLVADPIQ